MNKQTEYYDICSLCGGLGRVYTLMNDEDGAANVDFVTCPLCDGKRVRLNREGRMLAHLLGIEITEDPYYPHIGKIEEFTLTRIENGTVTKTKQTGGE